MDQDDPEQRIAELERRLFDANATAGTDRGVEQPDARPTAETTHRPPLTAGDIKRVAFSRPPIGKRGYNEDEVDAFLDLVEERLRNPSNPSLTAVDVQNMAFSKPPVGKRGYNEDEVDAFLDLVESEISRLDGTPGHRAAGQQHLPQAPPVRADGGSKRGRGLRSIGVGDLVDRDRCGGDLPVLVRRPPAEQRRGGVPPPRVEPARIVAGLCVQVFLAA
jgi:DivIVA domain-containing protein